MNTQQHISEDWETLINFLPEGWQKEAKVKGALKRCREVKDAETLLHILMLHLAHGYSLKETAVRVKASGMADVSSVAVFKRLRASGEWLRWMAEGLLKEQVEMPESPGARFRVRLIDATTVTEPGCTGSEWRIHYSLQLKPLRCDYFRVTDRHVGETFKLIPVEKGDLIIGDRAYGNARGVAHVVDNGGEALVRMKSSSFVLRSADGGQGVRIEAKQGSGGSGIETHPEKQRPPRASAWSQGHGSRKVHVRLHHSGPIAFVRDRGHGALQSKVAGGTCLQADEITSGLRAPAQA
jgi:hypothetical protein